MDDWVVLAQTRWKLRTAIRAVNRVMAALRVRQHPDKTIIGRIAREFEFLSYRCSAARLAVVRQTVEHGTARISGSKCMITRRDPIYGQHSGT
jgi:RNA-directed DNA polymerase